MPRKTAQILDVCRFTHGYCWIMGVIDNMQRLRSRMVGDKERQNKFKLYL